MGQWSNKDAPKFVFKKSGSQPIVATSQGWTNSVTGEVLVAIRGLDAKRADAAIVPTFTLAVPANKTYTLGQALTFIVTASEGVSVVGTPSIDVTIGTTVRKAYYKASGSTDLALIFEYILVAGDTDTDGIVVANKISIIDSGKGKSKILDKIANSAGVPVAAAALTYVVPVTTGILTSA